MLTDWVMIRRAAFELEERFRGARVYDIGLMPDGRTAIALSSRKHAYLLCFDIFGSPPLITVEDGELPVAGEPGFIRAASTALRGTVLRSVKSRKGDRLMRFTFGTRSKFGIDDEVELYAELVPRFGNIVLVKNASVVAAAKEFSLAQNGTRAVQAGMAYQPPQLTSRPPIAGVADPALLEADDYLRGAIFAYRRDGRIVQAYPVPLAGYSPEETTVADSLLDALRAYRGEKSGNGDRERTALRRRALAKRLDNRAAKITGELAGIDAKRRAGARREQLREQGETIYATLHEIDDAALRESQKELAATLFAEYKKLGSAIPHLDERSSALSELKRAIDELRWETERAEDDDLDDVAAAVSQLEPRAQRQTVHIRRRKRPPLEYRTATGSRILVGRSPSENAELTFKVARPDDLWFHAQNIPGAHVVLQRDDRTEPSQDDIARAAALAASFSKAKGATKVAIDYTRRKHVRAQRNAPPGLVWYTNAQTVVAQPE
ncbi:MAG: NFACT RNA binding domain-containing protein [Candidatus Eremiobacteraeota bacterium]|nr:NFACT RNA binding domain-containing protein [Candidatus Eremiobacteraeota bacterium]